MKIVHINIPIMSYTTHIDAPLTEFLAEVTAALAQVPLESRSTANIIISADERYGEPELDVELRYTRPETAEETRQRESLEAYGVYTKERGERAEYERLRAKYGA